MLPSGTKLIKSVPASRRSGRRTYKFQHMVFEIEPQVRTIRLCIEGYNELKLGGRAYKYRPSYSLSFPRMRFAFYGYMMYATFVVDGKFFIPMLPNIYVNGSVCMGEGVIVCPTNEDEAVTAIGDFWASRFDLYPRSVWAGIDHLEDTFLTNGDEAFDQWERMSKENPNFLQDIQFSYELRDSDNLFQSI
jgi:hypothetical protein